MLPGFNLKNEDTKDNIMTKRTNNDLQNIAQITTDRVTRTPLKTGDYYSPNNLR